MFLIVANVSKKKKKAMKKILTLFAIFFIGILSAKADYFSYTYQGKTLYYEITSSTTVRVTYATYDSNYVSGNVTIPSQIKKATYHNTQTYSVTSIGVSAFSGCSSLTSITIPNSVTSIGNWAFSGCSSLTSITIPNSVTAIGNYAFSSCSSLTSIELPTSVTSIGSYAFYGCSSLTSLEVPNSVTSIGSGAFYGCSGLTSVELPNSVTSIGSGAFSGCSGLTSIEIPSSVTSIDDTAFFNCSSLDIVTIYSKKVCRKFWGGYNDSVTNPSTLIIKDSVTYIDHNAFYGCSSLTSITIPNSVTSIGNYAFYGCSSLTSVTLPNTLYYLGNNAFCNCSSLLSVEMPKYLSKINDSVFRGCSSLTSIEIPNNVTKIGDYAFRGCSSLTNIVIPNSVTSIGIRTFANCSGLTSMKISSPLSFIGDHAFQQCNNLDTIICTRMTPPVISNTSVFDELPTNAILLVPCDAINNYKSEATWQRFQNAIYPYDSLFQEIEISATICENETYNFNGKILTTSGIYTDTLQNTNGCDSVITLTLNTYPNFENSIIKKVIHEGDSFIFMGNTLTSTGTYKDTLQTINGCDSVVTLMLTVIDYDTPNPTDTIILYDTIVVTNYDTINTTDTLIVNNYIHDTTIVKDTLTLFDTINTTDTLIVNNYIHDTTIVKDTLTLFDTINTTDTLIVTLYDTITNTIYDTIINTITDTITQLIYDTIIPCARIYTYIYATINEGEKYSDYGFTKTEAGTYTNIFKTEDGCDSTVVLYLTVLSGLDNVETSQIMLYPNPTNEKVYLSLTNIPNAEITIRDIMGNVVKKEKVLANETEVVLDVKDLASGTYTIMISNNKTRVTKKLIKR